MLEEKVTLLRVEALNEEGSQHFFCLRHLLQFLGRKIGIGKMLREAKHINGGGNGRIEEYPFYFSLPASFRYG